MHNADVTIVRWRVSQCGVCRPQEDTASAVSATSHIQVVTPIQRTPGLYLGSRQIRDYILPTGLADLALVGESTITDIAKSLICVTDNLRLPELLDWGCVRIGPM